VCLGLLLFLYREQTNVGVITMMIIMMVVLAMIMVKVMRMVIAVV
jgi:hypothetical protein